MCESRLLCAVCFLSCWWYWWLGVMFGQLCTMYVCVYAWLHGEATLIDSCAERQFSCDKPVTGCYVSSVTFFPWAPALPGIVSFVSHMRTSSMTRQSPTWLLSAKPAVHDLSVHRLNIERGGEVGMLLLLLLSDGIYCASVVFGHVNLVQHVSLAHEYFHAIIITLSTSGQFFVLRWPWCCNVLFCY